MEIRVGDKVGDYEVVELVGAGAVGQVFKVRHLLTRRIEALKVLTEWLAKDDPRTHRFLREIQVQAGLNHPNIAAVHNAFWWKGRLVMVMEFVEGRSLLRLLDSGSVPLPKGLDYVDQALRGLGHAHAHGVVHRDIKPANLIITGDGTVKITDFGLAKNIKQPGLTETGDIMGSVYYMSPEQVKAQKLDHRSDLYSLGAVLYELAAGRRPFDLDNSFAVMDAHVNDTPPPPSKTNTSLPGELDEIILTALEKSPKERFQSADEFRKAVASAGPVLEKRSESRSAKPALIRAGAPKPYAIMAVAFLFAVALAFFSLTPPQRPESVEQSPPNASVGDSPSAPNDRTKRPSLPESALDSPEAAPGLVDEPAGSVSPEEALPAAGEAEAAEPPAPPAAAAGQRQKTASPRSSRGRVPDAAAPSKQTKPSPIRARANTGASKSDSARALPEPGGYRLLQTLQESGRIGAVALSPDGKWVAASTEDNSIRMWEAVSGKSLGVLKGHRGRVVSLSVSPQGRLASGSWDGAAKVWNLGAKEPMRTFSHAKEVAAVALSPGGGKLAVALQDETIRIWSLEAFGESDHLQDPKRPPQAIAFSPNEEWLASVSLEKVVHLWRLRPDRRHYELPGFDSGATAVSFSPDGRRVAAAGSGQAKVWDVQTRQEVSSLGAPGWLHKLIPASGGSFFLLGATSDYLRLWNVEQSKKLLEIRPKGPAFSIALAAEGRRFAAATDSGLISIWETR